MPEGHRGYVALLALLLGAAFLAGLILLLRPVDAWGAMPFRHRAPEDELVYRRVQTVTLRSPQPGGVYTTVYGTRFQISIQGYTLGQFIRLPHDVVTNTASCEGNPSCEIIWGERYLGGALGDTPVVTFSGHGVANIYLDYETWERAERASDSPEVSLEYPVGPFDPDEKFSITNTLIFSREKDLRTAWRLMEIEPSGYIYSPTECAFAYTSTACSLVWHLTETSRLDFSATFAEPLLGSDLIIDHVEMSTDAPSAGESVQYTVTVRNAGAYTTGRAVIAGLFVRPYEQGPPVLTDTVGEEDALVDWIEPTKPPVSWTYWYIGLAPGERVTGTTFLEWPNWCNDLGTSIGECWVWGYVDCFADQPGFEWYGHNAEGLTCDLDEDTMQPTCIEELNNVRDVRRWIYLPMILRASG